MKTKNLQLDVYYKVLNSINNGLSIPEELHKIIYPKIENELYHLFFNNIMYSLSARIQKDLNETN